VNASAAAGPDTRRSGRIRVAGIVALVALAALIGSEAAWTGRLRSAWFDAFQLVAPRIPHSLPVTIVEIDQKSLAKIGQWPWPRDVVAELVDAINRYRPAAVALDILMPEPDAMSPERVLARAGRGDAELARALTGRPSNDAVLARSLAAAGAILAVAGMPEPTGMPLRAPPFSVRDVSGSAPPTSPVAPSLAWHAGVLTSIETLDAAASGHGLISVDAADAVIRRVPLAASINGTLVPALAIEMLRVALGAPAVRLDVSGASVQGITIGNVAIPTERDGAVRIYYSQRRKDRFVSAIDVLEGSVDPASLEQQLVLIGVTGLGVNDYRNTPVGERMPGGEIHAQLVENIVDQSLLRRPGWAPALEAGLFLLLGAWLIVATPRWKPQSSALIMLGGVALPAALAFVAFWAQRTLFDAATPALSLMLLYGVLLALTLAETTRQKKTLERLVQLQRERSARVAGELEAARRIQTATLPRADLLRGDGRIDIAATMVPARETGGDLYDFFRLDDRRLFFLVGDVAGKGLSASIFMAVSKALYKSATLRANGADIGELMTVANAEVSRDNQEMLFVTAFAGILDLETGELAYCNAGHDNPYLIDPDGATVRRIGDGDGPPLCAMSDFEYRGGRYAMRPGELLCVITDGVSEAQDPAGAFYGGARVEAILTRQGAAAPARSTVDALQADVATFAAGAEPADDLTILALRWHGSGTAG
jgi:adenylate cyclase